MNFSTIAATCGAAAVSAKNDAVVMQINALSILSANVVPVPENDELREYRLMLENILKNGTGDFVFNKGCHHAALLFNAMFSRAKNSICIYADTLRNQLTLLEPYCASLLDCLNRGVNVRILLNPRTDGENVPFLRDYLEQITGTTGNLKMLSYPDVAKNMTQTINDTAHFTLVDDNMYRIEYDIQEFKATASFNSEEVVKRLQTAFDMVWSMNPQHN